ncbi:L-threonine ammonia-lyase [Dongia mobilis]|uniref:L-threonine ammonia-lyase n=1 Tax=Dongia mobilis TaxID=578943 RepID=A0A4R6WT16_9PROT|nr:threonine/serine dehydratase [Dongia mobilis]TDQ82214.1 L-threonine ammonia-lyase [Dongia mobilis]
MVSPDAIEAAARRLHGHVRRTPVMPLELGACGVPAALTFKLELLQHSGSFKARGAFNSLLSQDVSPAGVIAASGGNHGAAVAFAARALGHRAEIFVPALASAAKVARIESFGATVNVVPGAYADALAASEARAAETGALAIHAYDAPATVAGQGTLARELDAQLSMLDTVLVAVGGGGLIGGVAAWFQGRVKVVGVEPDSCPTLHSARRTGHPVDVAVGGLAADSLGAKRVGDIPFAIAQEHVADVVLVQDEAIRAAQELLWRDFRLMSEPGGVTALAALTSGAYRPVPGEKIAVILCGGNVDPASLGT